ncbi:HET-domain-containing protein [Hypomontagnella monticulosa]|nr:HET-domain-containing protein [Hypomontagnella monticulosa]
MGTDGPSSGWESNLPADGVLCTKCASLDIAAIVLGTLANTGKSILTRHVSKEQLLLTGLPCPICDVILWMYQGCGSPFPREILELKKTVRFHILWRRMYGYWTAHVQILGFYEGYVIRNPTTYMMILDTESLQSRHNPISEYVRPYKVPGLVDYDRIRKWLTLCDDLPTHSHHCRPPAKDKRNWPTRLIDCETLEVVAALPSYPYFALSYVWGQQQQHPSESLQDPPATIRDAIAVTTRLGYRYLWVDRYCIDQVHSPEKQAEINRMDRIYNGASLTIIAAAGSDPNYGLPGVSKPRQHIPPIRTISKWTVAGVLDIREVIAKSVWKTRAWTCQEELLSRRTLFFTDHMVYFRCRGNTRQESYIDTSEDIQPQTYGDSLARLCPEETFNYISDYSKRKLTYDSDYLNGILGIFGHLAELEYPLFHLFGVPIFPRLIGKPGSSADVRYKSVEKNSAVGLMIGLSWRTVGRRRREPKFPSWSWAGWIGSVQWHLDLCGLLRMSSNNNVWVEDTLGNLLALRELYEGPEYLIRNWDLYKVIHIESMVFEVTNHCLSSLNGYHFGKFGIECKSFYGQFVTWKVKGDISVYASVWAFEREGWETITQGTRFKVLIIGKHRGPSNSHIMVGKLLREIEGGYEVAGHMDFGMGELYVRSRQDIQEGLTATMLLPIMSLERVRLL